MPGELLAKNPIVYTKNQFDSPCFGFKCYTHKVKDHGNNSETDRCVPYDHNGLEI